MNDTPARAQRFLRWLYDDQAGYMEIVAGRANLQKPDKIDLVMRTRRWCYYDPERPDLLASAAAYVAELANDYGNVYCGVRLYTAEAKRTDTRSEKYTKPSRMIFIDDAPAAPPIPYTASIQTSENSRHAYYKCDKPTTKDDARRAAAALGGDPSGVDLTQLVRIPGTFNTKRGQQWLVSVEPGSQPRYTLEKIRAVFPAVSGSAPKSGGAAWGEVYHAENWQNLPDGESLWRSAYIAAAGQRRPDLAKLLRNERVTIVKKDGTRDDSDSAQVAALAYNLLSANVCMPQARAIADYLYTQMRPTKTREHYRAHFDVELERYTPKHYNPQTIRSIASVQKTAPQPLPPAEYKPEPKTRARKDRPQRVSGAAGYLRWLQTQVDAQSGSVMLSQSQCAERLGCCIRTIKRYEKALSGQIERRIFAQRQAGCLFILAPDVVTTLPVDVVIASADTEQQSAENAQPAVTHIEHTPPPVTLAAPALDDFAPPDDDSPLDDAEIDRLVADVQAAQTALEKHRAAPITPHFMLAVNASERHEPQAYWQPHEIRAWQEAHPIAPAPPAAEQQRLAKEDRAKQRTRAKWDAMTPGQLARERAILRNFIKSHPKVLWPQWQLRELNERLASCTPETAGARGGAVCSTQTTPDTLLAPEVSQQRLVACEQMQYEQQPAAPQYNVPAMLARLRQRSGRARLRPDPRRRVARNGAGAGAPGSESLCPEPQQRKPTSWKRR